MTVLESVLKRMTLEQAKELARSLYFNLPAGMAEVRAESLQDKTDSFNAHRIIAYYLNHPMLSREAVADYIKQELGLEG